MIVAQKFLKQRVLFVILISFFAIFAALFAFSDRAKAAESPFYRNLKAGDTGSDVFALQKMLNDDADTVVAVSGPGSKGQETYYFGPATARAVTKFQNKYRKEILYPNGLLAGTGYVGVSTRLKLNGLLGIVAPKVEPQTNPIFTAKPAPAIFSVFPDRVRRNDTVTIIGENFTPTGNSVILGDGPLSKRFDNLSSSDGKTLTFLYVPPVVEVLTENGLRALPSDVLAQIEGPVRAAGGTLADVASPYKGIGSEQEFRAILAKNNLSSDALYHYFWVTVQNSNGLGSSKTALLRGIRKFPFETVASNSGSLTSNWADSLLSFRDQLVPVASAQTASGGFYSIVMICTCSGAVVTLNSPVGPIVWQPGFVPAAGSCRAAGSWLGYYIAGAGSCPMYIGLACTTLTFGAPILPIGCST